jgi:hypothetical protein
LSQVVFFIHSSPLNRCLHALHVTIILLAPIVDSPRVKADAFHILGIVVLLICTETLGAFGDIGYLFRDIRKAPIT